MKRRLATFVVSALLALPCAHTQTLEPKVAAVAPTSDPQMHSALEALKANHPQAALDALHSVLAAEPDNALANLLTATAALGLYQGESAVAYAEKARQLDPDNWKIHTTLVTAYAQAGKTRQRDAERDLLRRYHTEAKAKDAAQANGFLLDMFQVKQYRVDAVEFFRPVGKFHITYRFLVRNAEGRRVWEMALQSDDFNNASWAQAHPEEAAKGMRQYSLEGEGSGSHVAYRLYSGDPGYDAARAEVIRILSAQDKPFPGEASATQ